MKQEQVIHIFLIENIFNYYQLRLSLSIFALKNKFAYVIMEVT